LSASAVTGAANIPVSIVVASTAAMVIDLIRPVLELFVFKVFIMILRIYLYFIHTGVFPMTLLYESMAERKLNEISN
jgi:uncharacterized membrane protein YvlD (DUF360 family)